MIRTRVREIIELIRKHPKMRRILRCESPIFITGPYTATRRDVAPWLNATKRLPSILAYRENRDRTWQNETKRTATMKQPWQNVY